jgi:hypothetical protein
MGITLECNKDFAHLGLNQLALGSQLGYPLCLRVDFEPEVGLLGQHSEMD